jgi:hypothetical protein
MQPPPYALPLARPHVRTTRSSLTHDRVRPLAGPSTARPLPLPSIRPPARPSTHHLARPLACLHASEPARSLPACQQARAQPSRSPVSLRVRPTPRPYCRCLLAPAVAPAAHVLTSLARLYPLHSRAARSSHSISLAFPVVSCAFPAVSLVPPTTPHCFPGSPGSALCPLCHHASHTLRHSCAHLTSCLSTSFLVIHQNHIQQRRQSVHVVNRV